MNSRLMGLSNVENNGASESAEGGLAMIAATQAIDAIRNSASRA